MNLKYQLDSFQPYYRRSEDINEDDVKEKFSYMLKEKLLPEPKVHNCASNWQ